MSRPASALYAEPTRDQAAITAAMQCQPVHTSEHTYSDTERRQAVAHWLVLGNMAEVSRQLNIPRTTLMQWREQDWWNDYYVSLRQDKNLDVDCMMTAAVHKALNVVLDRLEHGNLMYIDGQHVRVGVHGRDAAVIAGILFDKRQLLRSLPTSISERSSKLDDLAGRFTVLIDQAKTIEHKP